MNKARTAAVVAVTAAVLFTVDRMVPGNGHLLVDAPTVVIGLIRGLTYALLGVGLVLIYRATQVINFSHGDIGAFAAVLCAKLTYDAGVPFVLAMLIAVVVGGVIGAVVEFIVVRRLFNAPRLVLLVATIGVSQLLFVLTLQLPRITSGQNTFPTAGNRQAEIGTLVIRPADFLVIAVVPAVIAGLTFFLTRTPYGTTIRASADNGDAARLAGISIKRVSTLVWVLAGALAALTTVLVAPVRNDIIGVSTAALGPALLLRALAAAMIGRLESLPLTLVGGLGVGVVEAVLSANFASSGSVDPTNAVFLVLIVGLLLLRSPAGLAGADTSSYSLTPPTRLTPERLKQVWWVRNLNRSTVAVTIAAALALPLVIDGSAGVTRLTTVLCFSLVVLSLTVLTGWAGQLSLGQFGFVAIGAYLTGALTARGVPFLAALAYATVGGILTALLLGFPALRIRGLFLAIVTLAFSVTVTGVVIRLPFLQVGESTGSAVAVGSVLGVELSGARAYYYLCLAVLVCAAGAVWRLRRTGIGRQLIASRDNERASAACTVSPAAAKLTAFAVSGGLATLAGGLYGGALGRFNVADFAVEESLRVVAMAVIGGLGTVSGAILGPAYVIGAPLLLGDGDLARFAVSGIGLLVFLMYYPAGLAGLAGAVRHALYGAALRRLPEQAAQVRPAAVPRARRVAEARTEEPVPDMPALAAENVTVRFGGRTALDDVSIEVRQGETVGLIGSNGAGKSTLMNVISGFVPADGRVLVGGVDVTPLLPHDRAAAGLGRAFQDARLFGNLTVRECVMVALEARESSELVPSMLALGPSRRSERRKATDADEILSFLGLGRYADAAVAQLSTGTRRIAELASLLAVDARVILLDEPTAGVAQKETEVFGPLIKRIQRELHATVVIIEHDIPLVMSMSDRVYCLGAGRVIAEGLPDEVRNDPAVIASYLGTDERAIQRSGATS